MCATCLHPSTGTTTVAEGSDEGSPYASRKLLFQGVAIQGISLFALT